MDLQFFGANCVVIVHKGTRVVCDDNLAELGAKSILKNDDVAIYTSAHAPVEARLVFDGPGEYETADISIIGIEARSHLDESGLYNATIFKIITDGVSVLVTGHIYPELNDAQLERIGMVDVLVVPVGGNGYTLDPIGAQKIIKAVEPKVAVPTHYEEKGLVFPVPQISLDKAISELGVEISERTAKLRIKETELSDVTQLVVLEKS